MRTKKLKEILSKVGEEQDSLDKEYEEIIHRIVVGNMKVTHAKVTKLGFLATKIMAFNCVAQDIDDKINTIINIENQLKE